MKHLQEEEGYSAKDAAREWSTRKKAFFEEGDNTYECDHRGKSGALRIEVDMMSFRETGQTLMRHKVAQQSTKETKGQTIHGAKAKMVELFNEEGDDWLVNQACEDRQGDSFRTAKRKTVADLGKCSDDSEECEGDAGPPAKK